jgi:hypothetical protein
MADQLFTGCVACGPPRCHKYGLRVNDTVWRRHVVLVQTLSWPDAGRLRGSYTILEPPARGLALVDRREGKNRLICVWPN